MDRTAPRSALAKTHAEGAPVSAAHPDRRRQVLHQDEVPAAHVPPVRLQQERPGARSDLLDGTIVEQAPIAAVRGVPHRIFALWLAIVRIVRRQVAALRPGDAEDDARVEALQWVL